MTTASKTTHVTPHRNSLYTIREDLRELWSYRELIRVIAVRTRRVRYKNSAIGLVWSLIIPLVQVFVLTVAIGVVLGAGPHNLGAYMLCAFLPWTFFQTAILDASSSVLSYYEMLKKVYMPREVLPIASILANTVHSGIAFLVFLFYRYVFTTIVYGWPGLPPASIWWLPVVILIELMLVTGVSFFLTAWTTFYEDVKYLVSTVIGLLLYLLPILYFAENIRYAHRIPAHFRWWAYHLYLANPMAWITTAFKQMFFTAGQVVGHDGPSNVTTAPFDWRYCAITFVFSAIILVWGYVYYNNTKWRFTERP